MTPYLAALLAFAIAPAAVASTEARYGRPLPAAEFVTMCAVAEAPGNAMAATACEAYIVGFLESAGVLEYANHTPPRYCLPDTVSPQALAIAVLARARRADPEHPAAMLMRSFLEDRYPCPTDGATSG